MKLLILHGPNMNLFGVYSAKRGQKITLDKINTHIRRFIRDKDIDIKIMQTHRESKAVSYIQKNRNKLDGMILTPGAWDDSGYILFALLDLIDMNYLVINVDEKKKVLNKLSCTMAWDLKFEGENMSISLDIISNEKRIK